MDILVEVDSSHGFCFPSLPSHQTFVEVCSPAMPADTLGPADTQGVPVADTLIRPMCEGMEAFPPAVRTLHRESLRVSAGTEAPKSVRDLDSRSVRRSKDGKLTFADAAWAKVEAGEIPDELRELPLTSKALLLAALCYHMHTMKRGKPFGLSIREVGRLLGIGKTKAAGVVAELRQDRVIKLATEAVFSKAKRKAREYYYVVNTDPNA